MARKCDFSGWATRNDLLCSDGRTIRRDAFKNQDGAQIPLIWMHDHGDPTAVLGHAILENREDGVYAYCTFNESEKGQHAKEAVKHGDVRCLSIWANKLKQVGGDVVHGIIREVSLVMAGANPGATIDFVMAHGDGSEEELYADYDENALVIYHSADKETEKGEETVAEETKKTESGEKTVKEVFESLTEEQKTVVYAMIGQALQEANGEKVEHSDEDETETEVVEHSEEGERTVEDVFNEMTEEQKTVVYAMIGQALEDAGNDDNDDEEVEHSDLGGENTMKTNVFDQETHSQGSDVCDAVAERQCHHHRQEPKYPGGDQ